MRHIHHSRRIHLTVAEGDAILRQIGLDEIVVARPPDLKIELIGVRTGGRPQDLTLNSQLPHDLPCLREVTPQLRSERRDGAFRIRIGAFVPGFCKVPGRMVQEQTAEGKQPREEEQKQSSIKMQFAIPALEPGSESRAFGRLDWSYWFSG